MENTNDISKLFLKTLVVSLFANGLLGIFIFLFGKFSKTEGRLLLTILSIGGCSVICLCCSTIYLLNKYKIFSAIGIGTAGLCFVFALVIIYGATLKILKIY